VENIESACAGRYLTLTLGQAIFAIAIHSVREILDDRAITPIPHSPDCMMGVVNVRGTAVPVVDLGCKFGLASVAHTQNTRIVIVELGRDDRTSLAGALADSVREVLEIDAAAIAPAPVSAGGFLRGIAREGERFLLVLDMDKVFPSQEMFDLEGVMASVPDARDEKQPNGAGCLPPTNQRSA